MGNAGRAEGAGSASGERGRSSHVRDGVDEGVVSGQETGSAIDGPVRTFDVRSMMTRGDRVLYWALTLALVAALTLFATHWARVPEWSTRPWTFAVLTGLLVMFLGQFLRSWTHLPAMARPVPPDPPGQLRIALITTVVPDAEGLDMLEATVEAMVAVRIPHDVWVLDEADDEAVRELCERLGASHFSRAGRDDLNTPGGPLRAGTKYGNVNAWLRSVGFESYDVVAAFDPDHVPLPEFLERTLGYFRDPGVGFVQAAQVYYNQPAGFVARGAAEETYAYYSSTLASGFGSGYTVMVGCHNVHRVSALREIDGLAPHDADDLLTALHYDAAGWRGVYVPEILAAGLTPVSWRGYLVQQRRWSRSVLDIKLRHLPRLWSRLRPPTRVFALLQGASYPVESLLPPLGILLLGWMLVSGETTVLSRLIGHPFLLLLLALAAIDVFRQRFYLDPERERGLHWRGGILRAAKWPFVAWGLVEALVGRGRRYEITGKRGRVRRGAPLLVVHLATAAALASAYVAALLGGGITHWSLHLWAPLIAGVSAAIFLSGIGHAPPAFDRDILESWRARTRSGSA